MDVSEKYCAERSPKAIRSQTKHHGGLPRAGPVRGVAHEGDARHVNPDLTPPNYTAYVRYKQFVAGAAAYHAVASTGAYMQPDGPRPAPTGSSPPASLRKRSHRL